MLVDLLLRLAEEMGIRWAAAGKGDGSSEISNVLPDLTA
jgi:hypothetical protein